MRDLGRRYVEAYGFLFRRVGWPVLRTLPFPGSLMSVAVAQQCADLRAEIVERAR